MIMVLVLIVHSAIIFDLPFLIKMIAQFGQFGCQIFFLFSGFCLCLSCAKRKETLISFYGRRMGSIYPGYLLTVLLSIFLNYLSNVTLHHNTILSVINSKYALYNILCIHGIVTNGANNQVVRGVVRWYTSNPLPDIPVCLVDL